MKDIAGILFIASILASMKVIESIHYGRVDDFILVKIVLIIIVGGLSVGRLFRW